MSEKIEALNVNSPHHVTRVDAAKFGAMKAAVMRVLPAEAPGMTPAEVIAAVKPLLPQDLFPGGDKAGWWVKCVQLDQEARGTIRRGQKPPVRLWRITE
jgi:hypothetical protein